MSCYSVSSYKITAEIVIHDIDENGRKYLEEDAIGYLIDLNQKIDNFYVVNIQALGINKIGDKNGGL